MKLYFTNKKITGILTVLPENEIKFEDEIENYNFSRNQSMKLKLIMGYDKRRVVNKGTTVSDLCCFGLNYLIESKYINKEDIDALILVTQSPDYFMPATSHVIQGRLNLKEDMVCLDITQACSGYVVGLTQAFMLLEQETINKVVVMNADTMSQKVSPSDRSTRPLTGDGASITIVEKGFNNEKIYTSTYTDGKSAGALIIPAGGYKTPSSPETAKYHKDSSGNSRSLDHVFMKGDEVFNFVQTKIPPMIKELLDDTGVKKEDVDYFLFHQPNKFMLKKLADKLGIPYEKMPMNVVENFGNANSVTIPTAITHNLEEKLVNNSLILCLSGFGAGLSWNSLLFKCGNLSVCKTINYK